MKKRTTILLFVVAISVLLVFGAVAEAQGQGQGQDKDKDKDNPGKAKGKDRGVEILNGETPKQKIKNVAEEIDCSTATGRDKAECRKQRREEIKNMIGNCTGDDNQTKKDCMVEGKRERWERRLGDLEDQCAQNVSSACRRRLNAVKECMDLAPGADRAACARDKLRLGKVVSQLVRECKGGDGNQTNQTNQSNCIQDVQSRVYEYATIKFQDLADRAADLIDLGVDVSLVDEFVAFIEESIIAFGEASSITEKKAIVLEVRHEWLTLIQEAKNMI